MAARRAVGRKSVGQIHTEPVCESLEEERVKAIIVEVCEDMLEVHLASKVRAAVLEEELVLSS